MAIRAISGSDMGFGRMSSTFTWTGLLNTDQGAGHETILACDRTFQVTGTFGTGGTAVMQGSNDGTNWFTLKDCAGADMSYTAANGGMACSRPRFVRPSVTGDGTTNLTCILVVFY